MDYAIVKNGLVINVVVLSDQTSWEPPDDCELVKLQDCAGIGWTYANGTVIAPEPEPTPDPEPVPVLTTEQKLEAAGLTVAELKELFGLS